MEDKVTHFIDTLRKFLAKETFKMAHLGFRFASFTKCVPFELEDRGSLRVKMFTSRWKIWLWHLVNFIYWICTAFMLITFYVAFDQKSLDEELILHGMFLMSTCLGCVFMVTMYLKPEACVVMINQHDFLLQATHDAGVRIPHWTMHNFSILAVLYFGWALMGIWSFLGIYFLWRPESSMFMYGYLPESSKGNYVVLGIFLGLELSKLAWNFVIMLAFFCFWCADIYTINSILAALMKKRRLTGAHVTLFHYMEIFMAVFNDFNGTVFTVGFNFMITAQPTFFSYWAITATNINPFIYLILPGTSIFSVFLIMYFFPQDAKVRFQSVQCLAALRAKPKLSVMGTDLVDLATRARNHEILNKKIEAFQPLGIKIWFFGVYSLSTSIELMDQLCNNLLLLLSF